MKPNMEDIPVRVLEWMTRGPFEGLEKEMQSEVLKYLSKSEYNELYETHCNLAKTLQRTGPSQSRKSNLLNLFDEVNQRRKPILPLHSTLVWKAASVLLLFSTLWFALISKRSQSKLSTEIAHKVDTLVKEIPSIVYQTIRDTIYVESAVQGSRGTAWAKQQRPKAKSEKRGISAGNTNERFVNQIERDDFQILTLNRMDKISNTSKRNSMNDDSLERNFKFVSL